MLHLINKPDTGGSLLTGYTITVVLICVLLLSSLSGFIPAFTIKSGSITNSLKGKISEKISTQRLRLIFMTILFSLTIVFIVSLMIITKQVHYLENKNLGFNKEQLLYIRLDGDL